MHRYFNKSGSSNNKTHHLKDYKTSVCRWRNVMIMICYILDTSLADVIWSVSVHFFHSRRGDCTISTTKPEEVFSHISVELWILMENYHLFTLHSIKPYDYDCYGERFKIFFSCEIWDSLMSSMLQQILARTIRRITYWAFYVDKLTAGINKP